MILSRSRYRDRDRIVRHSDFDSDFDFDQERTGKRMLFYPVKYHPPVTASSVIRVIKPNRRAACLDRSTAKRPEHTGDKVSPLGCQGGCAARRVGSYVKHWILVKVLV